MKSEILILSALLGLVIALTGCEETVNPELNQTEPQYVIEGLVTDSLDYHWVRISKTTDFYSESGAPVVTNAKVTVSDGSQTYAYVHNPSGINSANGTYLPQAPFKGVVGTSYSLLVEVDGKSFTANEMLMPLSDIDSLRWELDEDQKKENENQKRNIGRHYVIKLYAKEPADREDYYFVQFFRNDTIINQQGGAVFVSDDKLLGENINGVKGPGFYRLGDIGKVKFYSISRAPFVYYSNLNTLVSNGGGIFSSVPANPKTNITGENVLGVWQVSTLKSDTITIGRPQ